MSKDVARYRKYVGLLVENELIIGPIIEVRSLLEESDDVHEVDRQLVILAESLVMIKGSTGDCNGEPEWWCNLWPIARGEYPLDKLPDHVRELAQELYYAD